MKSTKRPCVGAKDLLQTYEPIFTKYGTKRLRTMDDKRYFEQYDQQVCVRMRDHL